MKAKLTHALAVVCATGLACAAEAQPLSRIIARMGLSPADFAVVDATVNSLLNSGTVSVGQMRSWTNEQTGSSGTVRVNGVRDNCVRLQHVFQAGNSNNSREVRTRRCRDQNGNWILTP